MQEMLKQRQAKAFLLQQAGSQVASRTQQKEEVSRRTSVKFKIYKFNFGLWLIIFSKGWPSRQ